MAEVAPGHAWPVGENMEAGPYSTDQGMLVVSQNISELLTDFRECLAHLSQFSWGL
jgi:hypothetical protein